MSFQRLNNPHISINHEEIDITNEEEEKRSFYKINLK